jgi:hypothetical protein
LSAGAQTGSENKLNLHPARLYVILAREASKAVILRRGPTRYVRAILWHTDSDEFEGGQWLRGRIYGERCALAPDGSLFLYFAGQQHKYGGGYRGTWSAISKPPYLTALALWPKGDTWGGGGVFIDNRTVCLQHCGLAEPHPDHQPPKSLRLITDSAQLTRRDQASLDRIKAQGWQLVYQPSNLPNTWGLRLDDPPIWHRAHPSRQRYYLARRDCGYIPTHSPGPEIIEYAVGDRKRDTEIPLEGASWADWDQRGRLVYARDGQIFAQDVEQIGTFARPLADFNDQTFESIAAPEWATRG